MAKQATHDEVAKAAKLLLTLPEGTSLEDAAKACGLPREKTASIAATLDVALVAKRRTTGRSPAWRLCAVASALAALMGKLGETVPDDLRAVIDRKAKPE